MTDILKRHIRGKLSFRNSGQWSLSNVDVAITSDSLNLYSFFSFAFGFYDCIVVFFVLNAIKWQLFWLLSKILDTFATSSCIYR